MYQTAYGEKVKPTTINKEPTRTKQALADNLDVNKIIKRYNATGVLPKATNFEAMYGDFDSFDLREAIEKVHKAEKLFLEVPSKIRANFNNDPGAFIDFATKEANLDQMRQWGLAPMPKPAEGPSTEPTIEPTTEPVSE